MFEKIVRSVKDKLNELSKRRYPTVFTDVEERIVTPGALGPGNWPKLFFRLDGQDSSGYVDEVKSAPPYLLVEHFAIHGLRTGRQGTGLRMAAELASLAKLQGIEKIIFWQTRPKPEHNPFFAQKMKLTVLTMKPHSVAKSSFSPPTMHPQAYMWVINPENEDVRVSAEIQKNLHPLWTPGQYYVSEKICQARRVSKSEGDAVALLDAQADLLSYVPATELEVYAKYAVAASSSIMRDRCRE